MRSSFLLPPFKTNRDRRTKYSTETQAELAELSQCGFVRHDTRDLFDRDQRNGVWVSGCRLAFVRTPSSPPPFACRSSPCYSPLQADSEVGLDWAGRASSLLWQQAHSSPSDLPFPSGPQQASSSSARALLGCYLLSGRKKLVKEGKGTMSSSGKSDAEWCLVVSWNCFFLLPPTTLLRAKPEPKENELDTTSYSYNLMRSFYYTPPFFRPFVTARNRSPPSSSPLHPPPPRVPDSDERYRPQ